MALYWCPCCISRMIMIILAFVLIRLSLCDCIYNYTIWRSSMYNPDLDGYLHLSYLNLLILRSIYVWMFCLFAPSYWYASALILFDISSASALNLLSSTFMSFSSFLSLLLFILLFFLILYISGMYILCHLPSLWCVRTECYLTFGKCFEPGCALYCPITYVHYIFPLFWLTSLRCPWPFSSIYP